MTLPLNSMRVALRDLQFREHKTLRNHLIGATEQSRNGAQQSPLAPNHLGAINTQSIKKTIATMLL